MPAQPPLPPSTGSGPTSPTATHGIVRVAPLLGAVPVLREYGIDPAAVLSGLGLAPDTLDDPDNCIHYRDAGLLLQRGAELTASSHFGLKVGQQASVQSLGLLGELMLKSPTVRSALRCLLTHLHLQTRGGMPTHDVEGDTATFGYAVYLRDVPGTAQGYDLVLAFECNILRTLCGPRWVPAGVWFSHAAPADIGPYRQCFGAPLHFGAERSEIRFAARWLDRALPGHEVGGYRSLQQMLAQQSMLTPNDCAEQVRRALRTMVLRGRGTEANVSALMSVSERSLRRALALQATSFRAVLDEVRFEIARQLLADTEMSTVEIADALDYGDTSAFTRAFKRWADKPPAAWRARHKLADGQGVTVPRP